MTIEQVIREVEDYTGQKATAATPVKDLVSDSLEFLDLMVKFNVPDSAVPDVETVVDIFMLRTPTE